MSLCTKEPRIRESIATLCEGLLSCPLAHNLIFNVLFHYFYCFKLVNLNPVQMWNIISLYIVFVFIHDCNTIDVNIMFSGNLVKRFL